MACYRIAVIDDDKVQIEYLSSLLGEWAKQEGVLHQVEAFESAEAFLFQYAVDKSFDLLLLDIEMGAMNGVELAKVLRQENREIQLIFITGYMEYISDGYDVEALHYLLKPVNREKLFPVLERAVERLLSKRRVLMFRSGDEVIRIPLYEICYVEVRANYITIHAKEDYSVKKTLSELENDLDEGFFRTGRSYVVNLQYIQKITKTDVFLKDGTRVPLSKGNYDRLNQAMITYF